MMVPRAAATSATTSSAAASARSATRIGRSEFGFFASVGGSEFDPASPSGPPAVMISATTCAREVSREIGRHLVSALVVVVRVRRDRSHHDGVEPLEVRRGRGELPRRRREHEAHQRRNVSVEDALRHRRSPRGANTGRRPTRRSSKDDSLPEDLLRPAEEV